MKTTPQVRYVTVPENHLVNVGGLVPNVVLVMFILYGVACIVSFVYGIILTVS